jgi:serine/alanine adding enzyme
MLVTVEYKVDLNKENFDTFVSNHPLSSMFQMSGWSIIKREWKSLRLIGEADGEIVCAAQILIRSFPLGQKLFYIPRGPLCINEEVEKDFFQYIKDAAKKQGAFCVKFDPNLVVVQFDHNGGLVKENSGIVKSFLEIDKDIVHKGFEKSLNVYAQPRYNAIVMATEDMVEHFSSSTKRNIKTALKKNVTVDRFSREKLESFAHLMDLTEQRKGVSLRNLEYFKRFFDAFENHVHLFMASLNLKDSLVECESMIHQLQQSLENASVESNQVKQQRNHYEALLRERVFLADMKSKYGEIVDIGGLLVLIHNDTCEFLYSGMNTEFSKFYPAYLMRLRAMEYARSQGCVHLNFGGIPGTLDDGLWEFKRSFGAHVIEYVGEFDVIIRPMIYHLFEKALPLAKRAMRKLKQLNKESK